MLVWGTAIVVGLVSCWATGRFARGQFQGIRLDVPNERSLHQVPTPRTGGLAVMGAFLLAVLALTLAGAFDRSDTGLYRVSSPGIWIGLIAAILTLVSLADDRMNLPVIFRLGVQAGLVSVLVVGIDLTLPAIPLPSWGSLALGPIAIPASILLLVWVTNLYNFMDGMDGFAGGMTVFGGSALACLAWDAGDPVLPVFSLLLGTAAAGFLTHNFPPAKIFLGDAGSIPIGFVFGALMILGVREQVFDIWVPGMVFSPFIVDATVTLIRRMVRGEKIWQAHRSHFYQRAVLLGWGHRRTVLGEYALMAVCAGLAALYQSGAEPQKLTVLMVWGAILVGLMAMITVMERTEIRRQAVAG